MSSPSQLRNRLTVIFAAVFAFVSIGLAPAYAVDERVIDVVEVTWAGAPAPAGNAAAVAKIIDTEVNADWLKFTAMFGETKDRGISFKTGEVLRENIELVSKMACQGFLASDFMSSIRPEAYKRLGISDYSNRYLLVISPKAGCVWSGRAGLGGPKSQSGTLILHDSASSFIISHELGHTFGIGHSNFLRCDNGDYDGPWGETCKGVEYGGTIDVMGNVDTTSPLNTYHQWRMGLIDDSQIKQVWQSEVINLAPSDFANGTKAIFVRDGRASYWIEYRRKTDGTRFKPGLAIYRLDPPPISAVVSPNPEDATAAEFGSVLGTDVWMLNLDTYVYKDSRSVGGSMTALTATTYSNNISFSAVASETSAVVTIKKKADITPPPVPVLVPVALWNSPNMVVLTPGNEDADTVITGFEGQIDGITQDLKTSEVDGWRPTYLSPFVAPKTLYLRDLPEGSYTFSMRAIDIVGNKSNWSTPVKVVIDRAHPVVTNDFAVSGVNANEASILWKGASDSGSGICQVNVVDEDGIVIQSSNTKNSPTFNLTNGAILTGIAQVFDCLGNGMTGDIKITNNLVSPGKSAKTGRWSPASSYGVGAIKCAGKCSASLTISGKYDVLVGTGAATVAVGNKIIATIPDSKVAKLRVGASIDVGSTKKVVRVSGSNFVLIGMSAITTSLGDLKKYDRPVSQPDVSLNDAKQIALSKYGFRSDDFSPEWSVLPMPRGTTLDDPTLDLCNGNFNSEKGRTERRQLNVFKQNSPFAFLSTEVVRYSSTSAVSAAHAELLKVFAQCQIDKGYRDATGALNAYEFHSIKNIPVGLVPEKQRVLVNATIGSGVEARQLIGFYQFDGDLFTGLYVLTASQTKYTDAQVAKWLKVAVTMAQRLQSKKP